MTMMTLPMPIYFMVAVFIFLFIAIISDIRSEEKTFRMMLAQMMMMRSEISSLKEDLQKPQPLPRPLDMPHKVVVEFATPLNLRAKTKDMTPRPKELF